jgi:hypothetical protein
MLEIPRVRVCTADAFRVTVCLTLFLATAVIGLGQGNPLTPGTVVTGQCQGHESEPGCVLPNLFGPQGMTLFPNGPFPHYAHFIGSAQTTLNQTMSSAIATQLAILPIISPASGFTYKFDDSVGVFVRSTTSFGPIYSERAETIGRGKVSFGVSYQRFRFGKLDGLDLHNFPAVFTHLPGTGPPTDRNPTYEADVIQTSNNIDLKMDQTMLYGTVGITDRFDLSVAIPIVHVAMNATTDADIIRVSGPTFTLPPGRTFPNPHEFDAAGSLSTRFTSSGNASGIGDVTFRGKANVYRGESLDVAFAMDVRTPTGDARQFLGSGAPGLKPFIAVSASRRFSPHINLGYQWNGRSILAGDITGTTVSENAAGTALIQNGPAVKRKLPDQIFYSLGADFGATKRLTLAADYLGQTLINAPRVFQSTVVTENIPGGTGSLVLPTVSGGKDTIGLNSVATGLKYNLFGRLLITADVLFRLDNKGLRQTVTPLVAISYGIGP